MLNNRWFAPLLVVGGSLTSFIGAALAVGLFATTSVVTTTWGRLLFASMILLAWRKPWRGRTLKDYRLPAIYGITIVGMTMAYYNAINLIPMGAASAIQFLGPILLAVSLGRSARTYGAAALAMGGVFFLSWSGLDISDPSARLGILIALAGAVFSVSYILLSKRATSGDGLGELALALGFGAIYLTPFSLGEAGSFLTSPSLLITVIAVAVLTSVITYVIDIVVLPTIPTSTYSLLTAISPAASLLVGVVMLAQIPSFGELAGLAAVSVSVILATETKKADVEAPALPELTVADADGQIHEPKLEVAPLNAAHKVRIRVPLQPVRRIDSVRPLRKRMARARRTRIRSAAN